MCLRKRRSTRASRPGSAGPRLLRIEPGELLQELAATIVLWRRDGDLDVDVLVAAVDPLAAKAQPARAARGPGGNLDGHLAAVQGRHVDAGTEGRLGEGQRHLDVDVVPFAPKEGIGLDA